jgi:hypothetical protein
VSTLGCDVGIADTAEDIQRMLPELFNEGDLNFDINKIDASAVTAGWNSKVGRSPEYGCMLTKMTCSKTIGRMRRGRFLDEQRISGIGYFSEPRRRYFWSLIGCRRAVLME